MRAPARRTSWTSETSRPGSSCRVATRAPDSSCSLPTFRVLTSHRWPAHEREPDPKRLNGSYLPATARQSLLARCVRPRRAPVSGLKIPLAYAVAAQDEPLTTFVNAWVELKRRDGTIDELFGHWILGLDAAPKQRRWSLLDDVWPR